MGQKEKSHKDKRVKMKGKKWRKRRIKKKTDKGEEIKAVNGFAASKRDNPWA